MSTKTAPTNDTSNAPNTTPNTGATDASNDELCATKAALAEAQQITKANGIRIARLTAMLNTTNTPKNRAMNK